MTAPLPRHDRVIAHRRVEPVDSLDYFPTPPWATRGLFVFVLGRRGFEDLIVEDPCCGEGHMAYPLADFFGAVRASDIHPYGWGEIRDFLDPAAWQSIERPDWIVCNPPFADQSLAFMHCALNRARRGVAMFVRTTQLDGRGRYAQIYRDRPPSIVAQFVERVPLHKERWIPAGRTFTSYLWLVWRLDRPVEATRLVWIPPICRSTLHYERDLEALPWSEPPPKEGEPETVLAEAET